MANKLLDTQVLQNEFSDFASQAKTEVIISVITKAKISYKSSNNKPFSHFVDTNKMVVLGSNFQRQIQGIVLTRYVCYLIIQNGDPRKETVAFVQTYFANYPYLYKGFQWTRKLSKTLIDWVRAMSNFQPSGYSFGRVRVGLC
ncbi:hypothetical protein [uncultured Gammaproteobacteria bacterium]|jgi:hypothetical protein|nr:hypothetical protein [uncultured Gammaproteobacteria bacterium]CAC9966646.1 hypothetical protein [uncultured Gammaproteobacteria bacterium]